MELIRRGKRPLVKEELTEVERNTVVVFKVLLPNGGTVELKINESRGEMLVEDFIEAVKHKYYTKISKSSTATRKILWDNHPNVYLEDSYGNKFRTKLPFNRLKSHILTLHDGGRVTASTFENMWDLTPDTDMLKELPEEYTFETALADIIDNSLQAVWSNGPNEKRLVCVTVNEKGISVFDSGPGMDDSDKNSIVKWGKIGASLHRPDRQLGVGGKPPYLTPYFGMFGYGGAIASMKLGSHAIVSSMTKESKKVHTLHLEREALLNRSGEKTWKTDGGIRDPSEEESSLSPHGSFTKVEIYKPKERNLDLSQLKCRLKDIYFPYIQCDEMLATGKTTTPIEFQVNGEDLAEIDGGEVAITNLLSCNGPEFVLQLRLLINQDVATSRSPGSRLSGDANARLKFIYFPIVEGKERIDRILERLNAQNVGVKEKFDTFSRVSIRRLGRLLPDARWGKLPLMEPKLRKGSRGQVLKRCCMRVKCFIDTDAGFEPTRSKTDLSQQHSCTMALRNFGNKPFGKENDARVEIFRDGKPLTLAQVEKEYEDWVFQMHDAYDEELVCGEDQPVLVLCPQNKKGLGISSEVVRVHQSIRRKGATWKSGQPIKIIKGAVGCHKNNVYATLEYILLEGFQGDVGGEARLICRPLDIPVQNGCLVEVNSGTATLDIRESLSFPISNIDSGKCKLMEPSEWTKQLEKQRQKSPSRIDLLAACDCQQLDIDGALPTGTEIIAGKANPEKIIAVIRPDLHQSSSSSNSLDKKYIIKDDIEMLMVVTCAEADGHQNVKHICTERAKPSSHKGIQGLYIFSLRPKIFQSAGIYTFSFSASCNGSSRLKCEEKVTVLPSPRVGMWRHLSDEKNACYPVRVGQCFPCLSIACFDIYNNQMPFMSIPQVMIKLNSKGSKLVDIDIMKLELSSNKMILEVSDMLIESSNLDNIRPNYEATLEICSQDKLLQVQIPCQVSPGPLHYVKAVSIKFKEFLLPSEVIEDFLLEMLDICGNHVKKGLEVVVNADGFCFQDRNGSKRVVDDDGCIDLSGILKVTAGYGESASLSVNYGGEEYFKKEFQIEKRMLRLVSVIPDSCFAGSQLEKVVFEIVNSKGAVDETIDDDITSGESHTLKITCDSSERFQYTFRRGRCTVSSIPIPKEEGLFSFVAAYSNHPDLSMNVKVCVTRSPKLDMVSLNDREDLILSPQSNGGMLAFQDSSDNGAKEMEQLVESLIEDYKELEDSVKTLGLQIGNHETKMTMLDNERRVKAKEIRDLEAQIESQSLSLSDYIMNDKAVLKRIEGKPDTAASVVNEILKINQSNELGEMDIIGLVALLGTVRNCNLSRMFAQYLGEDLMLAVVCKSYETACALERYEDHGKVDREEGLHAIASEFGKSINGRFHVICLEDISPFKEGMDHQGKLSLQNPLLPTGKIPPGFLGYAVNMINITPHHMHTKTSRGYGLRETLFYLLFGELQVYETRVYMKRARSYIKRGAISLDGGIIKGNGLLSLGCWEEPEVWFPVASPNIESQRSTQTASILKEITDRKLEHDAICDELEKESKAHTEKVPKFHKKKDRLTKFMNEKGPMISSRYIEYLSSGKAKKKPLAQVHLLVEQDH